MDTVTEMPTLVEENLAECGCIAKPTVRFRALKTQHKGQILEHPTIIGDFDSMTKATDAVEEERRNSGSFAVIYPLYECGHDHLQWMRYWE